MTFQLSEVGARALASATNSVVTLPPPENQIAIVIDGFVISAPTVQVPITSGTGQITGSLTEIEAKALATAIVAGSVSSTP